MSRESSIAVFLSVCSSDAAENTGHSDHVLWTWSDSGTFENTLPALPGRVTCDSGVSS